MTISGIALDKWAAGDGLIHSNIVIVSICFLISFSLFIIRSFQVWSKNRNHITNYPQKTLQACHLLAMFFSCFYMLLNVWNYFHVYIEYNVMNCSLWFTLIMISITMTKIFIYSFLMLRSSLSFRNGIFKIPLKISTSITIFSVTAQLSMMILMLSDFTVFSPFPNNAFCFRMFGPIGTFGIAGFNISDVISAFIAFIIFWTKSKFVKSKVLDDEDLNTVFNRHIKLGMLIVIGSILIFFAGEFLTILMGVATTLHQCLNNIYIFLLFKENSKLYNMFCKCTFNKRNKSQSELKLVELVDHLERDKHSDSQPDVKMMRTYPEGSEKQHSTCSDHLPEIKTLAGGISFRSKSFSIMPKIDKVTQITLTLHNYHSQ